MNTTLYNVATVVGFVTLAVWALVSLYFLAAFVNSWFSSDTSEYGYCVDCGGELERPGVFCEECDELRDKLHEDFLKYLESRRCGCKKSGAGT